MSDKVYSVEEAKRALERFCVYQDRSHKEVEEKLRKMRMIPEAIEVILIHLMEHNFLNEERFAQSFARGKFRVKKWGRQRITQELKMRNISSYNIKTALKEIEEEEYIKTVYEIAEKKFESIRETDMYKVKQKLFAFLQYRGYETDLIYKVINDVIS
ncbi:regulatory protein RecX [Aureivirga sp. CE67]|uniref:regulatory protein RecX n=1 Tax=Aureivirga sp. CE67 TaxID=1788983 RepID=UPI0018CA688E|nr:regulatory protein RecX [Aureivirga sp. CE67]